MAKTSLAPHATFPHIPAKAKTRAETGCSGCAAAALHPSCASFAPGQDATDAEKADGRTLGQWQWQVERRNLDGEGIKGAEGDSWYEYNGSGTINYVYFSSWNVTAADGTTLTLETQDGSDPREVLFNQYNATSPDDGTGIVQITYNTMGCVQPGAVGRFSDNSVLAKKSWPVIVKILSVDTVAKTLTVECDKSVSAALTHIDDEDTTDITIKVYQYASPENWQHVIKPDYFYGQRKLVTFETADIPTAPIDGVYTLEADAPVMHPVGFDDLNPAWVFEGRRIDDSTWETVPQEDERLFVLPDKAYVAFKDLKPTEADSGVTLTDDLTATYNQFRITYFKYAGAGAANCSAVGYSRCKYSLPDYTGSVQNYGTGHGLGTGYYCSRRLIDNHTLTDEEPEGALDGIRDTATHFQTSASGVARYPENGLCLMHGTCDSWSAAENETGRDAPFQYDQHIGNVLRELWGAMNHRVYRPSGGTTRIAQRIMHPSLACLTGYAAITTQQGGFHDITENFGASGVWGYPLTVTDSITGYQTIVPQQGPFENYNTADMDAGGDGFYPTYVTGFKTTRDQIDAGATVSIQDLERVGFGVDRDTGALVGRGISQSTIATAAQNLIVAPNIDTTLTDTEQSCSVGSFQRFSDASDAVVTLNPLRQETKPAENIGTRTVASVTDLGSGRVRIDFKNTAHSYGYVDSVNNPGVDTIDTWMGGGGAPIYPDTKNEIHNFYETDKSTGSKLRGAWRGDTIAVTVDGEVRHFILESVTPHGGNAEGSWGGDTPSDSYSIAGDYLSVGQLQDICVAYDENGTLAALAVDATVDFWWNAGVGAGGPLEWTEYGTDNWATVTGATAWPASGKWYIPDSWFSDKPENICFRVANFEWLDHRGVVPASLWEKTLAAINAVQWVNCTMDGLGGTYTFSKGVTRQFSFEINESTGCQTGEIIEDSTLINTTAGGSNGFTVYKGDPISTGSTLGVASGAAIDINTSPVGMPLPFRFFPDGTTLLDVKVEVNSAGLTRSWTHQRTELYDCDGSVAETAIDESSSVVEGVSFSIIGFTSENNFEVIGSVAAPSEGTQVISGPEITAVFQVMLDARTTGQYPFGYSAHFIPTQYANAGDVASLAPGAPTPTVLSGDCYAPCNTQYVWNEWEQEDLDWTSLSIGNIALKVQYPAADNERRLVQPRWPSMKDTV